MKKQNKTNYNLQSGVRSQSFETLNTIFSKGVSEEGLNSEASVQKRVKECSEGAGG